MGRESALRPRALIRWGWNSHRARLKRGDARLGMSTSTELVTASSPVASRRVLLAGYFHHSLYWWGERTHPQAAAWGNRFTVIASPMPSWMSQVRQASTPREGGRSGFH